jgi:hypothetical protein
VKREREVGGITVWLCGCVGFLVLARQQLALVLPDVSTA